MIHPLSLIGVVLLQLFVEADTHLAALTARHQFVRFISVIEAEAVGDEVFGVDVPSNEVLH